MIRGEISDAIPRRILVTLRAISEKTVTPKKKFFFINDGVIIHHLYNREVLSLLWKFVEKTGAALELIVFDEDGVSDDEAMALLEAFGTTPVNYARRYDSTEDLLQDLPYRPEVLGVLDSAEYRGVYGSWAVTPAYFDRIF